MSRVNTKREFYRLYEQGAFGNKPITFASVEEYIDSGFQGLINLRYSGTMGGAKYPKYCEEVSRSEALLLIGVWEKLGAEVKRISFIATQGIEDEFIRMQGEVMRDAERGLSLYYSTLRERMRPALAKAGQQVYGLTAKQALQLHLWPSSYDDVMELLEEYPDSVIELTAYSRAVGNCRNRNAIIWEVRNY